jgi:alcohol dehydrogenase class IV
MIDDSGEKKGIISGYLVPDAAYVDPVLTMELPAYVTAFTGMDALTHCIEAFANRNAQPMTDHLALEGVRLIGKYLLKAVKHGDDLEARSKVALGSLYGGMCLGPVNTAAVHALAYPLGSDFKIAHGISNALLLPYVMEYNLPEATARYAEIALALGAEAGKNNRETALKGIARIRTLIKECNLPVSFVDLKVPLSAIESLAKSAIQVQRLLKNNVKELTMDDIMNIYKTAYIGSDAKAR